MTRCERPPNVQDFASSSLAELIQAWVKKEADNAAGNRRIDPLREGRIEPQAKRDLLARVVQVSGPFAPTKVCEMLDHIAYHPIWAAALRSATPSVLFDKWARFERFAHSRNRLSITQNAENSAICRRTAVIGDMPSDAENLFICGLVVALLDGIGCREVTCYMRRSDGGEWCLGGLGRFTFPRSLAELDTGLWRLSWTRTQGTPADVGESPRPLVLPTNVETPADARTLRRVAALIAQDPSRRWRLEDLADEVQLSRRTLQRRLGACGFPVSRLIRLVRLQEACHLLATGSLSVTAVGFCAGYSDSAHLSRDFRDAMGISPTEFRRVHAEGDFSDELRIPALV
ncbi:helix-turn-helix domain-containing protein [Salipiger mucosus]|uniref:Helix-turn-helix, AraC type n=1 Tax=Salipiger mucosus DSM 16094 TaxID=1123237 RepID=S9SB87_9RHOB|nr:AraC family transcriptional regulator [Salipiger mucosus]EPX83494.1 Helix-turn-helix, AraC type [Salipiger mucosus DSM 16094]